MTEPSILNTEFDIKVAGTALTDEEHNLVIEVIVDQHTHLPYMFTIRMYDPDMALLDSNKFDLTKEIEIRGTDEANTSFLLIKGEITALEPEFQENGGFELVIRGYDKSHRLFRESKSQAFLNIKDSDLASQFAGNAGLSAQVEATSTVYPHLYQDNQSDLAFLMQRAWRIGYECFVDEGKLYFRKPPSSGTTVTLSWGKDLVSFFPSMTLAEQVDSVEVRGWDPKTLQAVLGQAQTGTLYPQNGDSKDGAKWAGSFGTGKHTLVDIPVVSQAEANKIAAARLDELSGAFVTAEGTALRRPDIKAGQFVQLDELGTRMSGKYMVTSATHIFTYEGLQTKFNVSGSRTGLLAEQMGQQAPVKRWPGVVTAVVTNTDDPDSWGRVKVKYSWMTEDAESHWARVAAPGAGPAAGFIAIPEVGDEVIIAFEHGDINFPVILGGMWNGNHALPAVTAAAAAGEKPLVRAWNSINGHTISMHDDADKKIEITTSGGHIITLDDAGKKVIIKSSGDIEITSPQNIKLDAGANLEISAKSDVKIDGMNVNITAKTAATLKGNASAEISASGTTTVKGSLVQIN